MKNKLLNLFLLFLGVENQTLQMCQLSRRLLKTWETGYISNVGNW